MGYQLTGTGFRLSELAMEVLLHFCGRTWDHSAYLVSSSNSSQTENFSGMIFDIIQVRPRTVNDANKSCGSGWIFEGMKLSSDVRFKIFGMTLVEGRLQNRLDSIEIDSMGTLRRLSVTSLLSSTSRSGPKPEADVVRYDCSKVGNQEMPSEAIRAWRGLSELLEGSPSRLPSNHPLSRLFVEDSKGNIRF